MNCILSHTVWNYAYSSSDVVLILPTTDRDTALTPGLSMKFFLLARIGWTQILKFFLLLFRSIRTNSLSSDVYFYQFFLQCLHFFELVFSQKCNIFGTCRNITQQVHIWTPLNIVYFFLRCVKPFLCYHRSILFTSLPFHVSLCLFSLHLTSLTVFLSVAHTHTQTHTNGWVMLMIMVCGVRLIPLAFFKN